MRRLTERNGAGEGNGGADGETVTRHEVDELARCFAQTRRMSAPSLKMRPFERGMFWTYCTVTLTWSVNV